MKILILYHSTLGGSSVVAYQQGIGIANLGVEVHFLGWGAPFSMDPKEIEQSKKVFFHQVQVDMYAALSTEIADLFLISQLVDLIKIHKIDLIHCHYALPFSFCAVIAKSIAKSSVKIVSTIHGTDVIGIGSASTLFHTTQFGLSQSDSITAVSKNLKTHCLESFNLPPKKIQVIPNFIHKQSSKKIPSCSSSTKKNFVIIHISNLRTVKNPIGALSIFREFQKIKKNCVLWILGDGPYNGMMQTKIRLWDLQDVVEFHEPIKNIVPLLSEADVCLVSSLYESFCLVALESISCGIPVVSPRVGGIPELSEHAPNSIHLYEEEDVQRAVDLLLLIYENVDLYKTHALTDLTKLKTIFSKDIVLQQYLSLYKKLLHNGENT